MSARRSPKFHGGTTNERRCFARLRPGCLICGTRPTPPELDEPGLLLYRSNLLGSDLRITNFGGGNTSAKVDAADPLTGEMVKVLWVKGSGGDLGSIKRDGFATLYLDRLETLKSHYRGLAHEDEMVEKLRHCTFDLNPRAASIDTPLHAFVPYAHVDHMHPDAVIAIAAAANSPGADAADFRRRDRVAALAAPRLRSRPQARTVGEREPASERRGARRPRPVHLGPHRPRLLSYDAAHHQSRRRMARRQREDAGLRRRTHAEPVAGGAAQGGLPPHAGDPVAHFLERAQDRPFHRRAGSARVRQFARSRDPRAARHELPRSFPAHQDPAADRAGGRRRRGARQARSPSIATTTPPITSAAVIRIRRRCAIPTPSSTSSPASA